MLSIIEYAVKVRVDPFYLSTTDFPNNRIAQHLNFLPGSEKIAIFMVSAGKMDKSSVKIMSLLEVYLHFSSTVEISNYYFHA